VVTEIEGDTDADRTESREGIIQIASDGSAATLLADQLDLYLELPRLSGSGDLSIFGNGISVNASNEQLYLTFGNVVEQIVLITLSEFTGVGDWSIYQ